MTEKSENFRSILYKNVKRQNTKNARKFEGEVRKAVNSLNYNSFTCQCQFERCKLFIFYAQNIRPKLMSYFWSCFHIYTLLFCYIFFPHQDVIAQNTGSNRANSITARVFLYNKTKTSKICFVFVRIITIKCV